MKGGLNTYAYVGGNPISFTDRTGLACDQRGCSVTPQEQAYADAGNYSAYYATACAGGDTYACAGGDVAANNGLAANFTNWRLRNSLRDNGKTEQACESEMESIRSDLASAHANALSGATAQDPRMLTAGEISNFHRDVFAGHGAGDVFGGDIPGSNYVFQWCTAPGCRP